MLLSAPSTLLLCALLARAPVVPVPSPRGEERRIELTADEVPHAPEIHIGPNQTSSLVFNAPLRQGSLQVQEREFFHSVLVDEGAGLVTVMPSAVLAPGRSVLLAVRFADGGLPDSATFRLVVHPDAAEHQVWVDRRARSVESYQQEARRNQERAERCEAAREGHECLEGLIGLIDTGLVKKGTGVLGRSLSAVVRPTGETLRVREAYSYRARNRVAVELWLGAAGPSPWRVERAELLGESGVPLRVLRQWQPSSQAEHDPFQHLVVEAEATEGESRGTFLLRLTTADARQTLTVRGVTFP